MSTAVDGRPTLGVQLLVGVNAFTLDTSKLDGPDHLGWDQSVDWSDVRCNVSEAHWRSGTTRIQGALTRYEAGTCELTLYDQDSRFDPLTGDAIDPGTPLRLVATDGTPLSYTWAWTAGSGTISSTASGILATPDPRASAANWDIRATAGSSVPTGGTYRVTCTARLVSGVPDGLLRFAVGSSTQTPQTFVNIPTDGSRVTIDSVLTMTAAGAPTIKITTGGTVQVTVAVDGLSIQQGGWQQIMWTGQVDAVDYTWPHSGPSVATVQASDLTRILVLYEQPAITPVGVGDTLPGRVQRWLAAAGLPSTLAAGSDTTGVASLQAGDMSGTAWDGIGAAVDAELGRVWVTADNLVKVKARNSGYDGPVRGSLSDVHAAGDPSHCCYTDAVVTVGAELLTNRAIANYAGAATPAVQVDDLNSQTRYRSVQTYERSDLLLRDTTACTGWAQWLVGTQAQAEVRIDSVRPVPQNNQPAWQRVCATGIGDRWRVHYQPNAGSLVDHTVAVLGLEHTVTRDRWDTTWLTTMQYVGSSGRYFTISQSAMDGEDLLMPS